MIHRTPIASIAVAAAITICSSFTSARADGFTQAQVGWGTNCWNSGNDSDGDTLNQSCEQALATAFAPTVWFDNGEDTSAGVPHFAAKSLDYAAKAVSIAYYFSYLKDGGALFGIGAHDGDSEFAILEIHFDGSSWMVDWMYLSAHRKATCDASYWYHFTQIEWDTYYRGWAMVYSSENKHANYASDSTCDAGCLGDENCDRDFFQVPETNRNVGQSWAPLLPVVQLGSAFEFYFDVNKKFCGWQRAGVSTSHDGCAGAYHDHLKDFGY
jgi:hypothetical protein